MTQNNFDKLWQPTLVFTNSLGPQNPIGAKRGALIREGNPLEEDISLAKEGNNKKSSIPTISIFSDNLKWIIFSLCIPWWRKFNFNNSEILARICLSI